MFLSTLFSDQASARSDSERSAKYALKHPKKSQHQQDINDIELIKSVMDKREPADHDSERLRLELEAKNDELRILQEGKLALEQIVLQKLQLEQQKLHSEQMMLLLQAQGQQNERMNRILEQFLLNLNPKST